MATSTQQQAIVALAALGQTPVQIATSVGVEIGDVASIVGGGAVQGEHLVLADPDFGHPVAATTPGTVIASVEVFDATGASLGFLPVYDAIT